MTYFWLEKHMHQWRESLATDHKPQAVIVSGESGMAKTSLLADMIKDLLCRKSETSCGQCQNCLLFQNGSHPDVDRLIPENNLIKVKQIRQLSEFFTSTPHCSDHKVAVIEGAHQMNAAAANALLKVLEEPPSRGLLFLVTDAKHQLMPTIRSRCITLDVFVSKSDKQQLGKWLADELAISDEWLINDALALSSWQPLTALELLKNDSMSIFQQQVELIYQALTQQQSIPAVAKSLSAYEDVDHWVLIQRYCLQLVKVIMNSETHEIFSTHPLNQLVKNTPKVIHIIIKFTDLINAIMLNFNTQIKTQLMIESVLIELKNELNSRS